MEEIRQQKAAEEIPGGISIEAYNTATQFGLQIAKKNVENINSFL